MLAKGDLVAGRYELERPLGAGGMGQVFLAKDLLLHRLVAVKFLLSEGLSADALRVASRRALREARAAAALIHPNVVTVFDAGEHDGAPIVIMEFVPGRTLRDFVGRPVASHARRMMWLAQTADALAAAHERGFVHRDIKPDNVIVRESDEVAKILDFGIAKQVGAAEDSSADPITRPNVVTGTLAYMAPEQLRNEAVDGRVDQFAWGVMAWELLVGELPWSSAATATALIAAVLTEMPPAPSSRRRDLPAVVDALVLRALAKDPADRFGDMREVALALKRIDCEDAGAARGSALAPTVEANAVSKPTPGASHSTDAILLMTTPLPASVSTDAVLTYSAALRAFHDASWVEAQRHLERAVTLDPNLAPAWVRLAITQTLDGVTTAERRIETFRRALDLRRSLTERDRAILRVWEPLGLQPDPDVGEAQRRAATAAAAHPRDAELLLLCTPLDRSRPENEFLLKQAIELDPEYADAWEALGAQYATAGRFDEADRALTAAVELSPASTDARLARAQLLASLGRAKDAESEARRTLALDPSRTRAWEVLAGAVYARRGSLDAVAEVLRQRDERVPDALRAGSQALSAGLLAVLGGRLVSATESWSAGLLVTKAPGDLRGQLTSLLVEALEELGDSKAAGEVATDHVRFADSHGWVGRVYLDPLPACLAAAAAAGCIADREVSGRRRDWLQASAAIGEWLAWSLAYRPALGRGVAVSEARAAMPTSNRFLHSTMPALRAEVGAALVDVGRPGDALPVLRIAEPGCFVATSPFQRVRSLLYLGHALRLTGAHDAARVSYQTLLGVFDQRDAFVRSCAAARTALDSMPA